MKKAELRRWAFEQARGLPRNINASLLEIEQDAADLVSWVKQTGYHRVQPNFRSYLMRLRRLVSDGMQPRKSGVS